MTIRDEDNSLEELSSSAGESIERDATLLSRLAEGLAERARSSRATQSITHEPPLVVDPSDANRPQLPKRSK
ncbi:MAG: hypothetical protein KDA95_04550 [Acidimicrobiales bacterium]|nr:hypothetical protein [Acidimicrobiales bacterium]